MRGQRFHGAEYDSKRDSRRLLTQQERVRDLLLRMTSEGRWMTVAEVASAIGAKVEDSVRRHINYLEKPNGGEYRVERRQRSSGLREFQMRPPREILQFAFDGVG